MYGVERRIVGVMPQPTGNGNRWLDVFWVPVGTPAMRLAAVDARLNPIEVPAMRRLLIEEPYSAAALWSRRLAIFSAAVCGVSVALARSHAVDFTAVMAVFAAALLVACSSVLLASTAAVVIWRTGRQGVGITVASLLVAALVLGYPTYLLAQAVRLPELNDVSTDLVNPPSFSRSAHAFAARNDMIHGEIPSSLRDAQERAYPNIQPIVLDLDANETWRLLQRAVAASHWRVVEETTPGGRMGLGHIDAIATSTIMGFPDDVTIRVRPLAGQTRVDIRSASRYGRHDFGSNARRIQRFSDELQAQLDAQ
jgi:uncharacterized protein (DUF1499 family)